MNKVEDINGLTELVSRAVPAKFYRLCKEGKGSNLVDVHGGWWKNTKYATRVDPKMHENIKVVIPLEYML